MCGYNHYKIFGDSRGQKCLRVRLVQKFLGRKCPKAIWPEVSRSRTSLKTSGPEVSKSSGYGSVLRPEVSKSLRPEVFHGRTCFAAGSGLKTINCPKRKSVHEKIGFSMYRNLIFFICFTHKNIKD